MMVVGVFINLLAVVLFIFVIRRIFSRGRQQGSKGGEVRRFFQYGLLFGSTVITGIGVSGLLGRLIPVGKVISTDKSSLAMESSFALIGIPLLIVIALWTRNTLRQDPNEVNTLGWNLYLTAASILGLVVNIDAQINIYGALINDDALRGKDISQLIVWGAIWFIHFRMHNQVGRAENTIGDHLIGSGIGLGISFVGLVNLMEVLIAYLFSFNEGKVIVDTSQTATEGLILLLVGAPIWYLYWVRTAVKATKESIWYAYVLLIGIGGGLLISVTASAFSLYTGLVWLFGNIESATASEHFSDTPGSLAAAIGGILVVWYHRIVLSLSQPQGRTEIRRLYEYVIAGISLFAASGGVTMIVVSLIESVSRSTQITGPDSRNTLLAALTLIIVGGPLWWFMWRGIENHLKEDATAEQSSLVRRIYLFILFGVSSVAAVISLLIATYIAFDDLFNGDFGLATLRESRFGIGILLTALVVAIYHWLIFKNEKDVEVLRASDKTEIRKLFFFVEMKVKADKVEALLGVLNQYAVHVRKEPGCERIDVLRDPLAINNVYLYEIWSDQEAHAKHLESPGFVGWKAYSDPLITSFNVKQLDFAQ